MTKITKEDKAQKNHKSILLAVRGISMGWFILGQLLQENKENKFWGKLGYESFREYLGQPEFGYKQAVLYRFAQLYEIYCQRLGYKPEELSDVSYDRLFMIKDKVLEGDKEEWLAKARTLSQGDLALELREEDANVGFPEKKTMPKVYRHKDCGKWIIDIDPGESCTCFEKGKDGGL
ncbi:hypothetical protein IID22_03850 [Patescibacteria group bacterium]|nr:hypothetical protein [Patescibacteria group bacterium]